MRSTTIGVLPLLLLLATATTALAQDTAAQVQIQAEAPGTLTLGLDLGPGFGIDPSGGSMFWVGPELGMKYFQLLLLLGVRDGVTSVDLVPRFNYDIEIIDRLVLTPFGGARIDFTFVGGAKVIDLGVEIGGRVAYWITPHIAAFLEPVAVDLSFFRWISDGVGSDTDFVASYRILAGATYRF